MYKQKVVQVTNEVPETITVSKAHYERLVKLARYVQDWHADDYEVCENCGALHPKHCICIQCGYDNSIGKIRE